MPEELVPHWGNYKKLLSFQKAECIYDLTYYFCRNFLRKNDRTVDQMIQAARSGKQILLRVVRRHRLPAKWKSSF